MGRRMRDQRRGFSLIELIVSIAILALFVGLASLSVGLLRGTDTRGLASKIDNSLSNLKSITQAHKGPYYLFIYQDDSSYYAAVSDTDSFNTSSFTNVTRLGSSSMAIETDAGVLAEGDYLEFTIQKKDGAYRAIDHGTDVIEPPKYMQVKRAADSDTADYTVVVAKNTGLHYVYQGTYPTSETPTTSEVPATSAEPETSEEPAS